MRRESATNDLSREVSRLRGAGPLSAEKAWKAKQVAQMMMEEDCRRGLLRGAPADARTAILREYVATGFLPKEWRSYDYSRFVREREMQGIEASSVNEPSATAGALEG